MERYVKIIPDGGERIMKMAERQLEHRISVEQRIVSSNSSDSRIGQIFAFLLALTCILSSVYLGISGYTGLAGIIASTTVLSLTTIFIVGKKAREK